MPLVLTAFQWLLIACVCAAAVYALAAALMLPRFGARKPRVFPNDAPGVTVLKPLCGAEPRLLENLSTFCRQAHPRFQLVFGVALASDPAIAVVRELRERFPKLDIDLVIDPSLHGGNRKVSNLINMMRAARHDLIVIADSDIAVTPDYLHLVTAPLADPGVGIVTCLYRALPVAESGASGLWQRIGALFVNEWFAPSVRVAYGGGSTSFGFGSTLALRRDTLEAAGGFDAIKDRLADDFWLAENTRRLGLRTVLAPIVVDTDVTEPGLAILWQRETRWLRTIRSVNPAGFASLFITFTTPWVLAGALVCAWIATETGLQVQPLGAACAFGGTVIGGVARLAVHARSALTVGRFWQDLPLALVRDLLLALEWLAAAAGSHVMWRGARVAVNTPA